MKKGKAATIRLESILQIGPPADLMHGLVCHQLFEQRRRQFPGDALELEKADVEPVGEQPLQILFEAGEPGSRCPRSISSARRSTRNFTPSGSALNWRRRVMRGGSSAARNARSAAAR